MKKIYLALTSMFVLTAFGTSAQETTMPYPKKQSGVVSPGLHQDSSLSNGLKLPNRPVQQGTNTFTIPVEDQLFSPIRWYALENADNPNYWKNVDTTRIWIELEVGRSLDEEEIAEFLESFGFGEPENRSMHPQATNFFQFYRPETTVNEIVLMAETARSIPGILFLEPSAIYKGNVVPNDPLWNEQWGPFAIYADEAWDYGTQGAESWNVLAVLDDAIDWLHEDLYDQIWYGYDYGFNDADPTLDGDAQTHGTHVTGIMSASNNNEVGIAGMCADTVYFAKVTDNTYFTNNGSYSNAAIINAMYDIGLMERVFVINLSLGGGAPSSAAEMAFNFAWNSGKLPIAASGNEGQSEVSYPAAYSACMAVGAIGTDGNELYLANYSNSGSQQEVTAPGGDMNSGYGIISTIPGNQYQPFDGTSMACPHVAGLAGLMKSLNPNLTNVEVRNIINSTCFDLGAEGWDPEFGYGMVNAKLALDIALGVVTHTHEEAGLQLKLYPNPVANELWVHNENHAANTQLRIFDLNGRLVQSDNPVRDIFPVDVSSLPNGVYIVQVDGNQSRYTSRFVKAN
ncbi:MAG: S8 family peptidase [Flavobacteriales bacterium]|nr:S8 family peptidase [Flavobacteriales bacterium]